MFPQEISRVFLNLVSNGFYAATKRAAEAGNGFEPTLSASTKNLGDRIEISEMENKRVRKLVLTPLGMDSVDECVRQRG